MTAVAGGPEVYEVPETDEERARFVVDGLGKAGWAMGKARDVAQRQRTVQAAAEEMIEVWQSWAARELEKLQRDRSFFEGLLERYAIAVRAADEKQKSVSTPFGVVETRGASATWQVSDADAFMPWVRREHPELIKTRREVTETLLKVDARKVLELTDVGVIDPVTKELVPGTEVVPAVVKATVKLDGFA